MKKIQTIFKRDWENNGGVLNQYTYFLFPDGLLTCKPTEKLDGTNVRITVRNHIVVRVEKRRNPDKIQKHKGIEEPWYKDIDEFSPEDKWVVDGVRNTDFSSIPDGEWSGELVGPNIQGNPLGLENNRIVFFTLNQAPEIENVPIDFEGLKEWLPEQKSRYGNGNIEGIVWHCPDGSMYKIKTKDFK
mgnify:FL=1